MIATYASFVWACYGITAIGLLVIALTARRSHARELQALRRRQQMNGEVQS